MGIEASMENTDLGQTIRAAMILESYIKKLPASRERALALTKVEECAMWLRATERSEIPGS